MIKRLPLPVKLKSRLYKTVVRPAMVHGSEYGNCASTKNCVYILRT